MHTKSFLCAALVSTISLVAASSTTTTTTSAPTSDQTKKAISELNSFYSKVATESKFSSYGAILSSAISSGVVLNPVDGSKIAQASLTALPGFTALPSDAQSYYSSIYKAEQSIISKDLSGAAPKPTGVMVAAGAAAAGILGVAAML